MIDSSERQSASRASAGKLSLIKVVTEKQAKDGDGGRSAWRDGRDLLPPSLWRIERSRRRLETMVRVRGKRDADDGARMSLSSGIKNVFSLGNKGHDRRTAMGAYGVNSIPRTVT